MPQNAPQTKTKFSVFFYNPVTYIGVTIAVFILVAECILFGIDFFAGGLNVYMGMITYLLLPPFLLTGLILIPYGALRKRRRFEKGIISTSKPAPFRIDPSIATHRNAIFIFLVGSMILIIMTAIGSYKAFHYTESVHFCGVVCHKVMEPEYTTYGKSPHARVKCVDCHIGAGADWYVRSKLSGLRQVYKTIVNQFPRPIPTPVHNLRPAKETCEQCHWPGKFFSSFEMRKTYYPVEESDIPKWLLRMLIRVGQNGTQDRGIHAHMDIDNDIYYAYEDERRQKITWVKKTDKNGKEIIYTSPDSIYKENDPPADKTREMDCMDCHSRPSHNFGWPPALIDRAIREGKIDEHIPLIKGNAIEALSGDYSSTREAARSIFEAMTAHYKKVYGESYPQHQKNIESAVNEIISIYRENFFPAMNVRWDVYPDNIGHLISPGCFRCHDNEHRSSGGDVIPRDCTICHTIIEQGPPDALEKNTDGLPFRHPFEEHEMWKEMNCHECHAEN